VSLQRIAKPIDFAVTEKPKASSVPPPRRSPTYGNASGTSLRRRQRDARTGRLAGLARQDAQHAAAVVRDLARDGAGVERRAATAIGAGFDGAGIEIEPAEQVVERGRLAAAGEALRSGAADPVVAGSALVDWRSLAGAVHADARGAGIGVAAGALSGHGTDAGL